LTGDGIEVRPACGDDLGVVLELWEANRSHRASVPDRAELVERLLLPDSPAALLVAERAGRAVGAVIAAWDGWRGNVYRLAVDAECRRRGVGATLVRAAEDHLRGLGARRITALVVDEDLVAARFWDALGYPRDDVIGRRVRNLPRQP
jgi:ribosomal protein S18 acetylase RimI-like enzyme